MFIAEIQIVFIKLFTSLSRQKGETYSCRFVFLFLYYIILIFSVSLQASLLSATCATFIRTLEECMTLANQSLTPDLRPPERVIL